MSNYKQNREVIVKLISVEKTKTGYLINAEISYNQVSCLYVYPIEIKQKNIPEELKKYVNKKLKKKERVNIWLKISNAQFVYQDTRADGEDWSCVCGIKSGRLRITGIVKPGDEIKSYHWYL